MSTFPEKVRQVGFSRQNRPKKQFKVWIFKLLIQDVVVLTCLERVRLVMVIIVILDDGSDEFVYVTEVDVFTLYVTEGFQLNVDFREHFGL